MFTIVASAVGTEAIMGSLTFAFSFGVDLDPTLSDEQAFFVRDGNVSLELDAETSDLMIELQDAAGSVGEEVILFGDLSVGGIGRNIQDDITNYASEVGLLDGLDVWGSLRGGEGKDVTSIVDGVNEQGSELGSGKLDFPILDEPLSVFGWSLGFDEAEIVTFELPKIQHTIPLNLAFSSLSQIQRQDRAAANRRSRRAVKSHRSAVESARAAVVTAQTVQANRELTMSRAVVNLTDSLHILMQAGDQEPVVGGGREINPEQIEEAMLSMANDLVFLLGGRVDEVAAAALVAQLKMIEQQTP